MYHSMVQPASAAHSWVGPARRPRAAWRAPIRRRDT